MARTIARFTGAPVYRCRPKRPHHEIILNTRWKVVESRQIILDNFLLFICKRSIFTAFMWRNFLYWWISALTFLCLCLFTGDKLQKDKLQSLIQKLQHFGHEVLTTHGSSSQVNGVFSYHNKFSAHSDSRRSGEGTAQFWCCFSFLFFFLLYLFIEGLPEAIIRQTPTRCEIAKLFSVLNVI